jgi:hypothetical protein
MNQNYKAHPYNHKKQKGRHIVRAGRKKHKDGKHLSDQIAAPHEALLQPISNAQISSKKESLQPSLVPQQTED